MKKTPTYEQLAALQDYAKKHGRNWKSKLWREWIHAQSSPLLMQVRNQFGPGWLMRFKLPK